MYFKHQPLTAPVPNEEGKYECGAYMVRDIGFSLLVCVLIVRVNAAVTSKTQSYSFESVWF